MSKKKRSGNPCKCKNSKCLKLYCECFQRQQLCRGCACKNCHNNEAHATERQEAISKLLERKPHAFDVKHLEPCNCKKSRCLKKYCDCFAAGQACSSECKCVNCKNGGDNDDEPLGEEEDEVRVGKRSKKKKRKKKRRASDVFLPPPTVNAAAISAAGVRRSSRPSLSSRASYAIDDFDDDDEQEEGSEGYKRPHKKKRKRGSRRKSRGNSPDDSKVEMPAFLTVPGAGPEFFQRLVRADCSAFIKRSLTSFSTLLLTSVSGKETEPAEREAAVLEETANYMQNLLEAVKSSREKVSEIKS